jgi:hypothetical protein
LRWQFGAQSSAEDGGACGKDLAVDSAVLEPFNLQIASPIEPPSDLDEMTKALTVALQGNMSVPLEQDKASADTHIESAGAPNCAAAISPVNPAASPNPKNTGYTQMPVREASPTLIIDPMRRD